MTLVNKVVAVTRPEHQADYMAALISDLGGIPYIFPLIKISRSSRETFDRVREILEEENIDYVVITSQNGVWILREELGEDFLRENLRGRRVIAIGPKTARELEELGIAVQAIPESYTSEALAERLSKLGVSGRRVLLLRAKEARRVLVDSLLEMGAEVIELKIYSIERPRGKCCDLFLNRLLSGEIDAITFTSSMAFRNLLRIAEDAGLREQVMEALSSIAIGVIGPITRSALLEEGVPENRIIMPSEYTVDSLVEALDEAL